MATKKKLVSKAKAPAKKTVAKKAPAKKVAKPAPKKAVAKAKVTKKLVVKAKSVKTKASAKKVILKKATPKKVIVKKTAKSAPKKVMIKKAAPKKNTSKAKVSKKVVKVTPKKVVVKKVVVKKTAPAKAIVKPIIAKKIVSKPVEIKKVAPIAPVKQPKIAKPAPAKKTIVAPTTFSKVAVDDNTKNSKEPKGKFEMEFVIRASEDMVFEYVSTESGLSEWFCDDVNIKDSVFTFNWDGQMQQARLVKEVPPLLIRYQWTDKNDGSYFEFRTQKDDLTNDVSLIITDFADNKAEEESARLLWHSQIDKLLHVLGSFF